MWEHLGISLKISSSMRLPGLNVGNKDTLAYFKLILFRDLFVIKLTKEKHQQASEDHFVATFFF